MLSPQDGLRAAKALIEAGWFQNVERGTNQHARDAAGRPVQLHTGARAEINREAASFTAYGAIATVMRREGVERVALVFDVLYSLSRQAMGGSVALGGSNYVHPLLAFNEAPGRTAAEVADLFERAAVKCEQIGTGPFASPIPLPSADALCGDKGAPA